MTARELALLAKKMRDKQREYFAKKQKYGGDQGMLSECKVLEKTLDNAVRDVLADKGPDLFTGAE